MSKLLVVVDMQNDFVDGALGSEEAKAIVPKVVQKIREWDGKIIFTLDTHGDNYMQTREGKKLPVPHCVEGTVGHQLNDSVNAELLRMITDEEAKVMNIVEKRTFGSTALPELLKGTDVDYIELVGLCTDICVVSNAMLLKAHYPEIDIAVDSSCCAGVTPASHEAALTTMKMCQIEVK